MVFIIKPVSAQLTKDKDWIGKSVILYFNYKGSLLCSYHWSVETEDKDPSGRREEATMV